MKYKKPDHTGRAPEKKNYVKLTHYMLESEAWLSLDPEAQALYVHLSYLYRGPGSRNGKIGMSVRRAAELLNVSKTTAARAFDQLADRGFIVRTKLSGFNMKGRQSAEYWLTEFDNDVTGATATKGFMRWSKIQNTVPPVDATVPQEGQAVPLAGRCDQKITFASHQRDCERAKAAS